MSNSTGSEQDPPRKRASPIKSNSKTAGSCCCTAETNTTLQSNYAMLCYAKPLQSCPTVRPQRRKPTRLPRPWDSPGKNTGVGCHFLLQCVKVKSEREVAQSCPTLSDPMDCSLPGSSVHGIFQAKQLYCNLKSQTAEQVPARASLQRKGRIPGKGGRGEQC